MLSTFTKRMAVSAQLSADSNQVRSPVPYHQYLPVSDRKARELHLMLSLVVSQPGYMLYTKHILSITGKTKEESKACKNLCCITMSASED